MENSLHWLLDIVFREEESRLHQNHSAQNSVLLPRFALSLIKRDPSIRMGVHKQQLRTGRDQDHLLRIISPLFSWYAIALSCRPALWPIARLHRLSLCEATSLPRCSSASCPP